MSGTIDIVCNLFTPREVKLGQTGLDEAFKVQVNMPEAIRGGVLIEDYLGKMDIAGIDRSLLIAVRAGDIRVQGSFEIPYQREIEEILVQHVSIAEAAVVGVQDEKWGEHLKAFVVVRPGAALDVQEVLDFCDGRLARIKTPQEVAFIDALPRNAGGKVLKTELRKLR